MDSRISARSLASILGGWRTREPAYEALADGIRLLCLDNRIAPRTGLPAERDLAGTLHVSRTTVAAAYRSLRDSGHIRSLRGSGSVTLSLSRHDPGNRPTGEDAIDLQQASPAAWPGLAGVYAEVAGSASHLIARVGYDVVGDPQLRARIAAMYTDRGVPTTADEVLVTSGAQSAIHLIASTLIGRGDRVLIETPTYPHAADAFRRAGARLVGVPVTTDAGWDLDRAEQGFARALPVLAYLMPDFQNPTGRTMSDVERAAIARAAERAGTVVIVDDTISDLDIDRPATPRMFGVGALPERSVIRLGSLGKTVWGGLRVGWVRADVDTIRRLVAARPVNDLGTPDFEQAVALALLPRMGEIVAQRSALLRASRDAAVAALSARLPQWTVPRVDGGVALWLELDAPLGSGLVLDARARGLYLSAGSRFAVDGGHDRHLRLPFTAAPETIVRAVDILADVWPTVRTGAPHHAWDRLEAVV